ncbi:MAG: nicotinate (nicotinamide) nucleotide adenylyltransferase [Elusimicrobia bacterium CG03_land_8_20_14_0_80_50_18]|nr:MAG: nicotinate (nicotinamide) nucleotide adenylyltransferase [Elusimicrobia bacterium CG03_land_8_20_14_0_80_50_18]PIX14116.1 MAG: nicotinate (nicotinamide) nucleotide adenylyltransferase [Elusimicrobia bacterium CG_4_8_14_3_um_filter_50_9]
MTGLFGGTFNPPHIGHMILAEQSLGALSLDKIIFIPSGNPPHKSRDVLSAETRYKLTVLAACLNPRFEVSDYEIKKDSVSYTIDMLKHFEKILRGEMIFLLGMDALNDLKDWKDGGSILNNFTLGVWRRSGTMPPEGFGENPRIKRIDAPEIPVSSSMIRKNIREGRPYRYLLPEKVYEYINAMELYL